MSEINDWPDMPKRRNPRVFWVVGREDALGVEMWYRRRTTLENQRQCETRFDSKAEAKTYYEKMNFKVGPVGQKVRQDAYNLACEDKRLADRMKDGSHESS